MRERFIYDENHQPIAKTPVLEFETYTNLGAVDLDYENTKLRLFGEPSSHINHIEYTRPDGKVNGILLEMFVDPEVADQLIELGYEHTFHSVPPPADQEWFDTTFLVNNGIDPGMTKPITDVVPPEPVQEESQPGVIEATASWVIAGVGVVSALSSFLSKKIS